MRVAVCVSGLVTSAYGGGAKRNNEILKEKFPTADFFYTTWETERESFNRSFSGVECAFLPEPDITRHPYTELIESFSPWFQSTADWVRCSPERIVWTRHHTKQIVAHSYLVSNLPSGYDVVVRTRYDAFISPCAVFENYLKKAYNHNTVSGFGTRNKDRIDEINVLSNPGTNWEHRILDHLIIHPNRMVSYDNVVTMVEKNTLHPAEYGWYQTLVLPNNFIHTNNDGWVNHDKKINI